MNRSQLLTAGLSLACLVTVGVQTIARADDLDEKQHKLSNKINSAAQSKQITADDAKILRKELTDFDEQKKTARNDHDGVLTTETVNKLDARLNQVSQDFETRRSAVKKKGMK